MFSCLKPKYDMSLREIDFEYKIWFVYKNKKSNDYNYSFRSMIPCHNDNYTTLCYQLFKSLWCDFTIDIDNTYEISIVYTSKDCKLENVIKEITEKVFEKVEYIDEFILSKDMLQNVSKKLHKNMEKTNNFIDDSEKIPSRFKRIKIYSDDSKRSIELCFSISKTPNVLLKLDCPVYEVYDRFMD